MRPLKDERTSYKGERKGRKAGTRWKGVLQRKTSSDRKRCLDPGVESQVRTEDQMFEWESGWGHR